MPSVLRGSFEHHLKGVAYRLRGTLSARKTQMLQPKQSAKGGTPNVVSRGFPHRISGIHVAKGFLLYLGPRSRSSFWRKEGGRGHRHLEMRGHSACDGCRQCG